MMEVYSSRIRLVKPPPKAANIPTRHLYVSGVGAALGHTENDIVPLFSSYGVIDCIELVKDSRFVFVSFLDVDSAIHAMKDSKQIPPVLPFPSTATTTTNITNTTKFFLKYAMEAKPVGPLVVEPDCTSTTADIHVPGCHVIPSFLTLAEEERLLHGLQQNPWVDPHIEESHRYAPSAAASTPSENECSRRVQHYGYPFNYTTLLVDPAVTQTPIHSQVNSSSQTTHSQSNGQSNSQSDSQSNYTLPFPSECIDIVDKMVNHVWIDSSVNFFTPINHPSSGALSSSSAVEPQTSPPILTQQTVDGYEPSQLPSQIPSQIPRSSPPSLTQLTVNEYEPGQGIGSHIDTYECFCNDIFVLSIGSGIVMTLQKRRQLVDLDLSSQSTNPLTSTNRDGDGEFVSDDDSAGGGEPSSIGGGTGSSNNDNNCGSGCGTTRVTRVIIAEDGKAIAVPEDYRNNGLRGSTQSNPQSNPPSNPSPVDLLPSQISQSSNPQSNNFLDYPIGTKKHLWLPPRSLLLLSGESRYLWSHGIARRGYDKVEGIDTLIRRGTRLSLTFRSVPTGYQFPVNDPSQIPSQIVRSSQSN